MFLRLRWYGNQFETPLQMMILLKVLRMNINEKGFSSQSWRWRWRKAIAMRDCNALMRSISHAKTHKTHGHSLSEGSGKGTLVNIYFYIQCNSNYFTLYKMSFLRKNMSYKMFENHCCRNSIVTWLWRHLFVRVVLSRVKFMFSCPIIFLSQQTQLWLLYWQNGAQLYFQSICAAEYE